MGETGEIERREARIKQGSGERTWGRWRNKWGKMGEMEKTEEKVDKKREKISWEGGGEMRKE